MTDTSRPAFAPGQLQALQELAGERNVLPSGPRADKLSKDFYWYSPILKKELDDKGADAVVRVRDKETLRDLIRWCVSNGIPMTPRGAGTGNYGQSIPLHGGVVVDLSRMDAIHDVNGVARVEPGARLIKIETAARERGWELRCYPSTIVTATMGGFLCGGSGGIGSITWGGINNADNVKSVTLLTAEAEPREIRLEERETIKALHTYGTTGYMVEIEMRLAPKVAYDQLVVVHEDWDKLLDWTDAFARRVEIRKRLVTLFQREITPFFTPMAEALPAGRHATFLLVDREAKAEVVADAEAAGLEVTCDMPLADPPKPPYITDYTWNHTTLWALKADPSLTYLQSGFGPNFREQFRALWERFPGEIFFHLEWTAGNAKMQDQAVRMSTGDDILVGGIPLVRYQSEARLNEIIQACAEIGVFTANPHTYILEEGGRHPNIAEKVELKRRVDPGGLLNPGKMKSFPLNPFQPQPTG